MRRVLLNVGAGSLIIALICAPFMVAIPLAAEGPSIVPALFIGGVLGLLLPLKRPGRPAAFGALYARTPNPPTPDEVELDLRVRALRKPWLMIAVTVLYLLSLVGYGATAPSRPPRS